MCDCCEELETKLRNLEGFVWEELVEENCLYKKDYGMDTHCTAGLTTFCNQDTCPRLQAYMRRK